MFEVSIKINDRVTVTASAEKMTELHEKLSKLCEVYGYHSMVAVKGDERDNETVVPRVRNVQDGKKDYKFFEMYSPKLKAKKTFGQSSDGSGDLFPHRKSEDGEYLPDNGWLRWSKEEGKEV